MTIRGTLMAIRVKKTTNDNSSQWNFLHPLAGLWKSCIFAGEKPIVCVPFR